MESACKEEESHLRAENEKLRRQVEDLRTNLVQVEIRNGGEHNGQLNSKRDKLLNKTELYEMFEETITKCKLFLQRPKLCVFQIKLRVLVPVKVLRCNSELG